MAHDPSDADLLRFAADPMLSVDDRLLAMAAAKHALARMQLSAIDAARKNRRGWRAIGAALGMSHQSAWELSMRSDAPARKPLDDATRAAYEAHRQRLALSGSAPTPVGSKDEFLAHQRRRRARRLPG